MIWKTNIKNKFSDTLSVTANGSYDIKKCKSVNVQVPTDMYKHILGNLTSFTPNGNTTKVGSLAYSPNLQTFISSNSVTTIIARAFESCGNLSQVTLNNGLKTIGNSAFISCTQLTQITIPASVTSMSYGVFIGCTNLTTVNLYNISNSANLTSGNGIFNSCSKLEYVTLGNGFNWNWLNLSPSTRYSRDTILGWFNALRDRSQTTTYKLTIGSTNLAKMTTDDIAIASAKNWTIA